MCILMAKHEAVMNPSLGIVTEQDYETLYRERSSPHELRHDCRSIPCG